MAAISRDRPAQRREHIRARAARLADSPEAQANLFKQIEASLPLWNGSLPYFVTVTSDEPRKNVGIFCKIAPRFRGKTNFVVIGYWSGKWKRLYE
jgi:hypothetical protein